MIEQQLNIPAIKLKQKEKYEEEEIYLGKISIRDFEIHSNLFKIDYYKRLPNFQDDGYQRYPSKSSIEEVKKFVLQATRPLLPTALILSSRTPLNFKEIGNLGIGELILSGELFIVDGQHRFTALQELMADPKLRAQEGNFEEPVVILSNFQRIREIEQFFIVNSKQNKIKADIAQRHLLQLAQNPDTRKLVKNKDIWLLQAIKIADILNEQIPSIWNNYIELPNDGDDIRYKRIITQSAFAHSLKQFFTGSNKIFTVGDPKSTININDCAEFLRDYWQIIAELWPQAVEMPQDYLVMKNIGVFAFHYMLLKMLQDHGGWKKRQTVLLEVRHKLQQRSDGKFRLEFWRSQSRGPKSIEETKHYAGNYSSGSGYKRLGQSLFVGDLL